MLNTYEM